MIRSLKASQLILPLALLTIGSPSVAAQEPDFLRRLMTDSLGYAAVPAMSPDGRWLVWTKDASDRENTLWIRAVAGGEERRLTSVAAYHLHPQFSPRGDRLIFLSSLPRRTQADQNMYLMAAPFDTQKGTLSGAPRQITLDPVRPQPRFRAAISPDGQRAAYVDNIANSVKVVPITGGNSTVLVNSPPGAQQGVVPGWLMWTPDGKSLLYDAREQGGPVVRYRISATGGSAVAIARSETDRGFGRPIPGTDISVDLVPHGSGKPWTLRFNDSQGKQIGRDLDVPGLRVAGQFFPSVNGRHIVLGFANVQSHVRVVPVAGGPVRTPVRALGYDWPLGWSADSRVLYTLVDDKGGKGGIRGTTLDGAVVGRVPLESPDLFHSILGDRVIIMTTAAKAEAAPRYGSEMTLWSVNPANGSRTEVAKGTYGMCCNAPGGGSNATGDRAWFQRENGNRLEIRELAANGDNRVLTDLPMSARVPDKAIGAGRVAYLEPAGNGLRLMVKVAGTPAVAVATYDRTQIPRTGEIAWSHDGSQLLVSLGAGAEIEIWKFDATGRVAGSARRISVPFAYQYDIYWLPDGSGFVSIAQMRDQSFTHVALVKLDDSEHPVLLTRDDPMAKWAHVPSPDGKYVAYQAEETHGGSAWAIDVAKALAAARKQ